MIDGIKRRAMLRLMAHLRLFYRVLKILGCIHGCHEHCRPPGGQGGVGAQVPIAKADTLRHRGVALLSRLLWYDKKQFKQFVTSMTDDRDLPFLLTFLHGYLGFCADPQNPFSTTVTTGSSSTASNVASGGHSSSKSFLTLCFTHVYEIHSFMVRMKLFYVVMLKYYVIVVRSSLLFVGNMY